MKSLSLIYYSISFIAALALQVDRVDNYFRFLNL